MLLGGEARRYEVIIAHLQDTYELGRPWIQKLRVIIHSIYVIRAQVIGFLSHLNKDRARFLKLVVHSDQMEIRWDSYLPEASMDIPLPSCETAYDVIR